MRSRLTISCFCSAPARFWHFFADMLFAPHMSAFRGKADMPFCVGKTAETNATTLVNAALVQAYGPVCIERFKHQPNVEAKWVELTKVDTWRRESYIKDSGFATLPGSTSPNLAVADACADALSKIIAMQAPAAK